MSDQDARARAEQTYAELIRDLSGRQGLEHVWSDIDVDTRNVEIRPAWVGIIAAALSATADTARAQGRQDAERLVKRLVAIREAAKAPSHNFDLDWQLSRLTDDMEAAFGLRSSNLDALDKLRARATAGDTP